MVGMPAVTATMADSAAHAAALGSAEPAWQPVSQIPPPERVSHTSSLAPQSSRSAIEVPYRNSRVSNSPDPSTRVIYHVNKGAWTSDPTVLTDRATMELRGLSDELYRQANARCRIIRVASVSNSRYAKSQVAAQLACTLAERRDKRVLLVEADLDAPALHKIMRLNVPVGFGFSEQLERFGSDASGRTPSDTTLLRISHGLHALVESKLSTPAMFDSLQFSAVLSTQRQAHDVIVIDGPVVDDWPDCQALRNTADVIVFVVASGTSLIDAMKLSNTHFEHENLVRTIKTGEWPDT
jgi:Mrp family chromosome partitioning ATPase